MDEAFLTYFAGSPFARMGRVLVREWDLPIREVEYPFPAPPELFEINPLGQVPALRVDGETLYPTFLILERLWSMAGSSGGAYDPERDRQVLLVTLQAGDALAAALYQGWAGLQPVGPNYIGYDPAERNLARVGQVMAWLEGRPEAREDPGRITLPRIALACLLLWSEARDGPLWPEHEGLWQSVRSLEARPSFTSTVPRAWAPWRQG
jgi:glutathione S-transferase